MDTSKLNEAMINKFKSGVEEMKAKIELIYPEAEELGELFKETPTIENELNYELAKCELEIYMIRCEFYNKIILKTEDKTIDWNKYYIKEAEKYINKQKNKAKSLLGLGKDGKIKRIVDL